MTTTVDKLIKLPKGVRVKEVVAEGYLQISPADALAAILDEPEKPENAALLAKLKAFLKESDSEG